MTAPAYEGAKVLVQGELSIHDLQIMDSTFHVHEMMVATTEPPRTPFNTEMRDLT